MRPKRTVSLWIIWATKSISYKKYEKIEAYKINKYTRSILPQIRKIPMMSRFIENCAKNGFMKDVTQNIWLKLLSRKEIGNGSPKKSNPPDMIIEITTITAITNPSNSTNPSTRPPPATNPNTNKKANKKSTKVPNTLRNTSKNKNNPHKRRVIIPINYLEYV